VPDSFVRGPVQRGAALYSLEGDFGFSPANGTPETGHEIKLINFSREEPLELKIMRFAHNKTFEQAFVSCARGFNRPMNVKLALTAARGSLTTARCATSASLIQTSNSRLHATVRWFRSHTRTSSGGSVRNDSFRKSGPHLNDAGGQSVEGRHKAPLDCATETRKRQRSRQVEK
jgi:hypothetical protein